MHRTTAILAIITGPWSFFLLPWERKSLNRLLFAQPDHGLSSQVSNFPTHLSVICLGDHGRTNWLVILLDF
jgi:hypothetical protein